jgi:hypothetical protein
LGVRIVESGLTLTVPAADEELVEAAQRRELARGRALRVVLRVQVREKLADRQRFALELLLVKRRTADRARRVGVPDLSSQELAELDQVGAVALDRVIAEVSLELQVVEKLLDQRGEVLRGHG